MLIINSLVLYCTILMLFSRGGQRKLRGEGAGPNGDNFRWGGGGELASLFSGAPCKIDEQAIGSFTYNRWFKAKIIVFIDVG